MNIKLVDFKIEFGKTSDGEIVLADEVSPDTCRLWDMHDQRETRQRPFPPRPGQGPRGLRGDFGTSAKNRRVIVMGVIRDRELHEVRGVRHLRSPGTPRR